MTYRVTQLTEQELAAYMAGFAEEMRDRAQKDWN